MYREVGIISGVVPVKNLARKPYGGRCWTRKSIRLLHKRSNETARRIQAALAENGDHTDLKTILNSMKRQGLKAKAARKFKVTTDSNHQLPVAPNLLEQNFSADAPNQKWVGDITYLLTNEGWLYLAVIIDLYSRAVVGWSMNSRMSAESFVRSSSRIYIMCPAS